jgi:tetratricopeptide (TPR) repeat protein
MSSTESARDLLEHGLNLHTAEKFDEAFAFYVRCIREFPSNADGWHLAGAILLDRGKASAALPYLNKAIAISGRTADFFCTRARALQSEGRYLEALNDVQFALSLDKDDSSLDRLILLGGILCDLQIFEAAEGVFRRVLARDGLCHAARSGLGEALVGLGRANEAVSLYDALVSEAGGNIEIWVNRGNALVELGNPERALEDFDRALNVRVLPDLLTNKATALIDLGSSQEALACLEQALAISPNNIEASFLKSLILLKNKFSLEALELYEARLQRLSRRDPPFSSRKPLWEYGGRKRRVFIWKEQGLGDQLFFLRYLPAVCGRSESVVVEVDFKLKSILARSHPGVRFVTDRDQIDESDYDCHIAMGSLPFAIIRVEPEVQSSMAWPPLIADAGEAMAARARYRVADKPLIGVCWKSFGRQGSRKSIELDNLLGMLRGIPARFVSLQYGISMSDVDRALVAYRDVDFHFDESADRADLDTHAGLIAACDSVIMVANTSAHLAGCLGVPGVVISRSSRSQLWFWSHVDGGHSKWYPSLRVASSLEQAVAQYR